MTVAIYPGSFDPVTNGHMDVLYRASKLFDHVIIAVLENKAKKSFISVDDRVKLIEKCVVGLSNVQVDYFHGLTVDYAKEKNAKVLIRGLRAVSDFEYEMQMAQMNKSLYLELETIFLVPLIENTFLSSSIVKEVAILGGDISKMVPAQVLDYFANLKQL